jgi:uncharacterized membrane protein
MGSAMFVLVPEIITAHTVLTVALISFVLAVIFALFAVGTEMLFLGRRTESLLAGVMLLLRTWVQLFGFTFPASLIGYISGYLATMNRTSAIGTILPAVLALIGGLNIYIFGTENRYRYVITYCVSVFTVMLFYGTQYGGYMREAGREARLQALTAQELRIKILRRNLNLPDDFPSWMVTAEPK